MSQHHPVGPSKQGLARRCPGFYRMSQGISLDTSDAAWGRRMHQATVTYLVSGFLSGDLSEDERQWAKRAALFARGGAPEGAMELLELPVNIYEDLTGTGPMVNWGTADYVNFSGDKARLVDWKFYRSAPRDDDLVAQLANYAVGVAEYAHSTRHLDVVEVEAVAYNPIDGRQYRLTFTPKDFPKIIASVKRTIKACMQPEAPLRPAISTCSRCPGVVRCPAAREQLDQGIVCVDRAAFGTLAAARKEISRVVSELPAETVLEHLEKAQLAKIVAEALICAAKDLLADGHTHPSWELQEIAGRRRITDPAEVLNRLVEEGVPAERLYQAVSVSITKLEDVWAAFWREQGSTRGAKRKLAAVIEDLVDRASPSRRLVPRKDKELTNGT